MILSLSCAVGISQNQIFKSKLLTYGGLPVSTETNQEIKVLFNTAYVCGYSEEQKNPAWVAYRAGNMKGEYDYKRWERPYRFFVDTRTEAKVDHKAYSSSGYDRGHMAPNAVILSQYGQMAQMETYFMSNICPQKKQLNRLIWAELETKVREEISQDDTDDKEVNDVYVITGPIYEKNPMDTLKSGVAIPTSFYKIMAYRRGYLGTIKAVAVIMPQLPDSDEILDYVVNVDEIEQLTGLNFFPELSNAKQNNLESKKRNFLLKDIN